MRSRARGVALTVTVAIAIAAGIFFRFYHLGYHGFWGDEGITALRVAGFSRRDVLDVLERNRPVPVGVVDALRVVGSRGIGDTVHSLAVEDPQHPPMYYVAAQLWERSVGSSYVTLRTFSALIGLLLLPALYWLSLELFGSRAIGLIAAALGALSPFHVEYAQQAREYGLWAVLTAAASAALLRALRSERGRWWTAYGLLAIAGLYAHPFFGFALLGHVGYVLGIARLRFSATVLRFLIVVAIAVLCYAPWASIVLRHAGDLGNAYRPQTPRGTVYAWIVALALPFVDLEAIRLVYFAAVAAALALIVTSFAWLIARTPFRIWWFVVTLTVASLLLQIGNRGLTDMPRYLTPVMIGSELAVAWLLGQAFEATSLALRRTTRAYWLAAIFVALLVFDAFDCMVRAQHVVWWTNAYGAPLPALARIVDGEMRPALVIGDPKDWEALEDLSAFLSRSDRVWAIDDPSRWKLIAGNSEFLFSRFPNLHDRVSRIIRTAAITVEVPPTGYALLEARRGSALAHTRMTWLWRAQQR